MKSSKLINNYSAPAIATFDHLELHRYPSPSHIPIKDLLCNLRDVPSPDNIFLGVGSDEVIDLLFRISCVPGKDRALICPPTYGMYGVCAQVNDVGIVRVNLEAEGGKFTPRVEEVSSSVILFGVVGVLMVCCAL